MLLLTMKELMVYNPKNANKYKNSRMKLDYLSDNSNSGIFQKDRDFFPMKKIKGNCIVANQKEIQCIKPLPPHHPYYANDTQ